MQYCSALLLLILLTVFEAFASEPSYHPEPGSLTVLFRADRDLAPNILAAIENELRTIFREGGLELHFEDSSRPPEIYNDSAVVRFRGACIATTVTSDRVSAVQSRELGITHTVDGAVIPFADIDCDAVRRMLSDGDLRSGSSPAAILGRAIGRVVAHELYHILLNDTRHGRRGLAEASFSRSDLLAKRKSFDARDLQRIVTALQRNEGLTPCNRCETSQTQPRAALSFLASSSR